MGWGSSVVNQRFETVPRWQLACTPNWAMLAWAGSAVRVEEAFPDADAVEREDYTPHSVAEGLHKHISANTRLQLHYDDSNSGQRHLCARAIEVDELEMVVEAERRVPVGAVVTLRTAESGFVGRACVQSWEPNGFDYRMSLRILDSHAREL